MMVLQHIALALFVQYEIHPSCTVSWYFNSDPSEMTLDTV